MRHQTYRPRRSLRERFYTFMYGRNGTDALGRALLIVYVVLYAVALFVGSYVLWGLMSALAVYAVFRMLSRNLAARRRENEAYLRLKKRVTSFFGLQKNKWRDRKTHVYRRCPACKSVLRLPKSRGKHTVRCPRCQHRFETKV